MFLSDHWIRFFFFINAVGRKEPIVIDSSDDDQGPSGLINSDTPWAVDDVGEWVYAGANEESGEDDEFIEDDGGELDESLIPMEFRSDAAQVCACFSLGCKRF